MCSLFILTENIYYDKKIDDKYFYKACIYCHTIYI